MNDFVEIHLGRTITLAALADLLNDISLERFQGFVRINESGHGRFAVSFARAEGGETTLFMLIRENPSQLYAEPATSSTGQWVLEVYAAEISVRTGALIASSANRMLHPAKPLALPTFADWLLSDPGRTAVADELFAAYASAVPLPLRGVVSFKQRPQR